jgi:L-alanine-DL-glutamate epimerase-like enolase superfamily enzyme
MSIARLAVNVFEHPTRILRDSAGHAHASREAPGKARLAMLRVVTEDGAEGYAFGPPEVVRRHVLDNFARKALLGRDAFDRERIWRDMADRQRGSAGQFTDRAVAIVEQALWDWAGRKLGLPVHKLIGGFRDKVRAYGSTMCGDEQAGGLATPEDYGRFAEKLVARGYKGIKIHTWMPPVAFAPDPKRDVKACAAVREAVGPDIALMLDGYHWYSRTDALHIGRELERLGFTWFEEPMEEDSIESYVWLASNLSIPILGPESLGGKFLSRAAWAKSGACDILRAGAPGVGGIGPCLKVAHLAESFGMNCEVHGNGAANLNVIGAIRNCDWYERGLLHPFLEYDETPAWLKSLTDPMDADGFVAMPARPGLGEDIDFAYIEAATVERY